MLINIPLPAVLTSRPAATVQVNRLSPDMQVSEGLHR